MRVPLLAGIDVEINAMPMGYNSLVGNMGVALSGGQKQRILLARALYRRPQIVFLDESFDQLDLDRESMITDGLRKAGLRRGHRQPSARHGARGGSRHRNGADPLSLALPALLAADPDGTSPSFGGDVDSSWRSMPLMKVADRQADSTARNQRRSWSSLRPPPWASWPIT